MFHSGRIKGSRTPVIGFAGEDTALVRRGSRVSSARSGSSPRLLSVYARKLIGLLRALRIEARRPCSQALRLARSTVVDDMQQEFVNTASGDALRGPSLPGAGAKQEQRLFRDLPELLSTAADGPVMCRGFSISAGQQIV